MCEYFGGKLAEQPCLVTLRKFLEDAVDTLAPRIPDIAEPVPSYSTGQHSGEIRHDETHSTTTQASNHTPELPCRLAAVLGHALFSQHLLEYAAKLLRLKLGLLILVVRLGTEAKGRPGEVEAACRSLWLWNVFVRVEGRGGSGSARPKTMVGTCGVIVSPTRGVREGVVGIVDLLELAGALGAFW